MRMETFTRASGPTEKQMEWAYSSTQTDQCTKVNGKTTSSTDSAPSPGTTIRSSLPVTLLRARRQERVGLNLKVAIMKEISSMVNSMDSENTTLLILVACTKDNSKTIIWKEKER